MIFGCHETQNDAIENSISKQRVVWRVSSRQQIVLSCGYVLFFSLIETNHTKIETMEDKDKEAASSSPHSGSKDSDKPDLPTTVNVPAAASHFLPIEGEENFAGRQGPSSSSGNSSDTTSEDKKKKRSSVEVTSSTALTDSESSSELAPREKEKRRRIEYLSTAKGGLRTSNEKLHEENRKLRETIEAIRNESNKKTKEEK